MANTTKYLVTVDGTTEEFSNVGLVGKFLGKKVTKADILEGKYPEVTLADATTEDLDEQYKADMSKAEQEEEAKALLAKFENDEEPPTEDGMEVPDDIQEPELDEHTQQVLTKIEQAINDTPEEDAVLFDALCNLEDSIRDQIALTDEQATLLTAILTGTLVTQPLTNTEDEGTEDDTATDEDDTPKKEAKPNLDPEQDYPEVGDFKDEKAIKKYIKGLSDSSLEEWCNLEGVEWKHSDHQSINRMRMAMAIKALHFKPATASKGKKSKSKYASYSTEDLVSMALENDIEVPDDKGDMRICRMYTIMALRKAGLID